MICNNYSVNISNLGSPASSAPPSAVALTAEKDLHRGLIRPGLGTIVRYFVPNSDSPEPPSSRPRTPSSLPDTPRSTSSFLSTMDNDRIASLEQTIAGMQEQQAELYQKLEQFLKASTQRSDPPVPATPTLPSLVPPRSRKARPSVPTDFDGDRSKGTAFLNSCQTYIRLCPEDFADEQTKIIWAMSYMKSGHAQKWTARIFRWEQQPENSGANKFFDWEDFRNEFRKEFTPAHSDALAINRLESAAYYQKNRPLDDYIDEFQDLVTESGYSDPKTIVVKFRRGLNPQIQNAVAM